jgi:hypothetical protein
MHFSFVSTLALVASVSATYDRPLLHLPETLTRP